MRGAGVWVNRDQRAEEGRHVGRWQRSGSCNTLRYRRLSYGAAVRRRPREAGRGRAGGRGVPVVRWGPDTIERRHLFEAWHEAARSLFDTAPCSQERSFSGGGAVARLGDLVITDVSFTAQRITRTRHHVAETDYFSLQLYTCGGLIRTSGDTVYRMAPDRIALFDFGREHHALATQPSEVLGASIPRDRLDIAELGQPAIMWARSSTAGGLLSGALHILREDMDRLSASGGGPRGGRPHRPPERLVGLVSRGPGSAPRPADVSGDHRALHRAPSAPA